MFRPSANMLSINMFGTCLCVHTQGWESETSFKLAYFEFIIKNAMEVKYRGKIKKIGIFLKDVPDVLLLSVPFDKWKYYYKCPELETKNNTQTQLYISSPVFFSCEFSNYRVLFYSY